MPMQDGFFMEGDIKHPIGRCILVFAGGVYESFADFAYLISVPDVNVKVKKILDFASRLRGVVNIWGINPKNSKDQSFLVRRAIILRGLIERKTKILYRMEWFKLMMAF